MRRSSLGLRAHVAEFLSLTALALGPACYPTVPNDGLVDASFVCTEDAALSGTGTVGPGGTCSASPGTLPAGNCHLPWTTGSESCPPSATACTTASPEVCGGDARCMPMAKNAAPTYDFRMGALHIVLPTTLTNVLLQNEAITAGVTPNAPLCGNEQDSTGAAAPHAGGFNWLISLDSSKGTIKTGGALPVRDPYQTGYCFLSNAYDGVPVAPVTLDAVIANDAQTGAVTFSSSPGTDVLNVPIFLTESNPTDPIILPIRGAEFHDVTISSDGNCIGDINQAWYCYGTSSCTDDDLNQCPKWYTGGAVGGYLTLADADKIVIQTVGKSLCALLVQETAPHCTAADLTKGDYCSTTQKATQKGGGCSDSDWLAATFAASAVKISQSGSSPCSN
jgi:hypothetical protein